MRDKDFALLGLVLAGVVGIIMLVQANKPVAGASLSVEGSNMPPQNVPQQYADAGLPVGWDDTMDGVYDNSNAGIDAYSPPDLGDLTINVQDGALAGLSNQYIPLFGFVGMAQGEMYQ